MLLLLVDGLVSTSAEGRGEATSSTVVQGFSAAFSSITGLSTATSTAEAKAPQTKEAYGRAESTSLVQGDGSWWSVNVRYNLLPILLKAEFQKQSYTPFAAVKIQYKYYTFRSLDTAGIVNINGEIYTGSDPQQGKIISIEAIEDGVGDEAPSVRIMIQPSTTDAAYDIMHPNSQGAIVQIFIGAVEQTKGILIGAQEIFFGIIDTTLLEVDEGMRQITLDCVSGFEYFFDDDEGVRLTDSWHQSVWPGEQGLIYVTDIERQIPWGADSALPPPATSPVVNAVTPYSNTNYPYYNSR